MENLNLQQLENVNGGDWKEAAGVAAKIGFAAAGGIEVGVGMAGALTGIVTFNPIVGSAGGCLVIDGINHLSNLG